MTFPLSPSFLSVCIALQASAYCAGLLPLTDVVNLLVAAASCFLSPSPAVVASTPACIHVLTDAAKGRAAQQQHQEQQPEGSKRFAILERLAVFLRCVCF